MTMNSPSVVIIGASNLVSKKKEPLEACNCLTPECTRKDEHLTNLPENSTFQIFAQPGAKINHPNEVKSAETLFKKALALRPKTIVFYMDIIMNSLTSPPWLPNLPVLSPQEVLRKLFVFERKANAQDIKFVVVLCRRRKEDKLKLQPGTSRQPGDAPLPFDSDSTLDNEMNTLLKENFFYYSDLKLSNAAFKINDSAHQTQLSLNLSLGKIIRFFNKDT